MTREAFGRLAGVPEAQPRPHFPAPSREERPKRLRVPAPNAVTILPDIHLASTHGLALSDTECGLAGMAWPCACGHSQMRSTVEARDCRRWGLCGDLPGEQQTEQSWYKAGQEGHMDEPLKP